nr:phosphotransferase [Candidatus Nitrosoglobus terrae]
MNYQMTIASGDASFRRYFRLRRKDISLIVMDAPPERENPSAFIYLANELSKLGLNVPKVLAQDLAQGFLLLSDLGEHQYLNRLNSNSAQRLYGDALAALLILQSEGAGVLNLPLYTRDLLIKEMKLFGDWYLGQHLNVQIETALDNLFKILADSALDQPQVPVHRDYHSRNLMVTEKDNPGILDFQDAVKGPVTYDLVSLLRDCYIAWPQEKVVDWLYDYQQAAMRLKILVAVRPLEFMRWFDWMGVQRHLKAIGIFTRLNYRDGKSGYLKDIPRILSYLSIVANQYSELADLAELLRELPKPKVIE